MWLEALNELPRVEALVSPGLREALALLRRLIDLGDTPEAAPASGLDWTELYALTRAFLDAHPSSGQKRLTTRQLLEREE